MAGHVCLDLVCRVPTDRLVLEPGGLAELHDTRLTTGGAVSNTGLALQRLGVRTRLMGSVGDDALADVLRDALVRGG
ncbi:MAG: PfkB family carbohydrate kinase, partial [Deinococcales bacterium]